MNVPSGTFMSVLGEPQRGLSAQRADFDAHFLSARQNLYKPSTGTRDGTKHADRKPRLKPAALATTQMN